MAAGPGIGVTAEDVGNVLLYIAPGFFARIAYTARFPQPKQEQFFALIVSVAASVPIIALGHVLAKWWGWPPRVTSARYVLLLICVGVLAGYIVAWLRDAKLIRATLHSLGIPFSPEATVYEQTVLKMPRLAEVTVTFNDGRIVSGYPGIGPAVVEPGDARELYLRSPRWWDGSAQKWAENDNWQGVIISLDEVASVLLDCDPTIQQPTLGELIRRLADHGPSEAESDPERQWPIDGLFGAS